MTTTPTNIDTHEAMTEALAEGRIKPGDRVHVSVCGQMTEDAFFEEYRGGQVYVRIGNITHDLYWGDIQEMWPVSLSALSKEKGTDAA